MKFFSYTIFFLTFFIASMGQANAKMVYDNADLLSQDDEKWIKDFHGKLLEDHDIDYRIITLPVEGDLGLFATRAFKKVNVGSSSKSGKGLLLVIDPENNAVRLEVSASLEHIYTDSFVAYLQTRQMVPFFAKNRIADGILATSEFVFQRAREAAKDHDFIPPKANFSAGGGAQRDALIGKGDTALPAYKSKDTVIPDEVLTPLQVVDLYNRSMRNRDANFMKRIYTEASQVMMQEMVVTPAQMDNAIKAYNMCGQGKVYTIENLTVVKYDNEKRSCFPYFLLREDNQWKLDFVTMGRTIRFNHKAQWHFVPRTPPLLYAHAFGDSTFDQNGYPHDYTPAWLKTFRWQISYYTLGSGNTYITWVGRNSPAEKLGAQYGDRILSWMGKTNLNQKTVIEAMNQSKPGDKVWAIVLRDGKEMRLNGIAPPYKK